jgi:aerobic-type carbon monoxide dehydrogenase small subunit (CoxS/CutS family)
MSEETEQVRVPLRVNGRSQDVDVSPRELLVQTLRRRLGLTSVRGTCGLGLCGTCTVLLDGKPVTSCLLLAQQATGHDIVTSEGLLHDGDLSEAQEAFVRHHAYQCGYCIPGMVVTLQSYLDEHPAGRDAEEMRELLGGNLCRCGSYGQIVDAITELAAQSGD